MSEISKSMTIQNKLGLHARAATQLVKLSQEFSADIIICQDDKCASADSLLTLLMLESSMGKEITVKCKGPDAQAAVEAVENLVNARFNESE